MPACLKGMSGLSDNSSMSTDVATAPAPSATAAPRRRARQRRGTLPTTPAYLMHLLRRTTFGITPELLTDVEAVGGAQRWLEAQLAPASLPDPLCDATLARFPLASATPPQVHAAGNYGHWNAMYAVQQATFTRAVWSKRQLFEVMVEFWSNHLNITCPSSEAWATKPWDDVHVIRKHALGRFEDMLVASGTSPAMMLYLDNASSKGAKPGEIPNENYGRELLELHTVGRDAGYGQSGVVDCARAFTGLSVWNPWNGGTEGNYGTFRYVPDWHYTGPLKVLDWTHPNSDRAAGVEVATSLLRYLARHPATARRIAHKLAVRFVSDDPPTALVDRLAATYLGSGTSIAPVLRLLFSSPEFIASTGRKYRRPFEDVVASVRAVGAVPSSDGKTGAFGAFCWLSGELGQAPLAWHPPDGYPDVAAAWVGTGSTLGRWNMHVGVAGGWWKDGIDYPGHLADRLLPTPRPADRAALVDALHARLLPGLTPPPAHREALVTFLGGHGPLKDGDTTWLFSILVGLVLDSPLWVVR